MRAVDAIPVELVPNAAVIEVLEGALSLARAGEIDGVVILCSHPDGSTSDRWGQGRGFWWIKMIGAAEVWKKRYIDRFTDMG